MSLKMALDAEDDQSAISSCHLGKMMDAIKKGTDPLRKPIEKNIGTYGRFKAEDGAVK